MKEILTSGRGHSEVCRIIYDFGSNNGDNIPYYLKKADVVVAVEANPVLCRKIRERFDTEIRAKRLHVENCVLTTDDITGEAHFYLHKLNDVLSQFPQPQDPEQFDKVLLPSQSVIQLVRKYGDPYYIKVDIEHYDAAVLRALFEHDIRPPYISAESHNIEVFAILVSMGGYRSFKLVDGFSVFRAYANAQIISNGKVEMHSFPFHSAGPFGEDVSGDWLEANSFFRLLALENLGWKDIHATNMHQANQVSASELALLARYFMAALKRKILDILPGPFSRLIAKL